MVIVGKPIAHIKDNVMYVDACGLRYRVSIWPPSKAYPRGVVEVHELPSYLYPVRGHNVCVIDDISALEDVVDAIVNEYAPNRAKYLSRWHEQKFIRRLTRACTRRPNGRW